MNKHQDTSSGVVRAQPARAIPVPRIVKSQPAVASAVGAQAQKVHPNQPLKPANVMKAARVQKHAPWLTTAKIPLRSKIP